MSAPRPNAIRRGITIDGTSQPQVVSSLEESGIALVAGREDVEQALAVLSAGNTIRDLAIGGFRRGTVPYGAGAGSNTVADYFIGLAPGDVPATNETGAIIGWGRVSCRVTVLHIDSRHV